MRRNDVCCCAHVVLILADDAVGEGEEGERRQQHAMTMEMQRFEEDQRIEYVGRVESYG